MGKLREGMGAAIDDFVTLPTVVPCLPTLPFIQFQPSDLQSILHLNPPHGSTQQLREGLGNQSPLLRPTVSRTPFVSAAGFQDWSHLIQKAAAISSGELYPKGFSLTPLTVKEPLAPLESEERGIPPLESRGV